MNKIRPTLYLLAHAILFLLCGAITHMTTPYVVGIAFLAAAFFAYRILDEDGQDGQRAPTNRSAPAASQGQAEQPGPRASGAAGASKGSDDELTEQVERLQQTVDALTRKVERLRGSEATDSAETIPGVFRAAASPKQPERETPERDCSPAAHKADGPELQPEKPRSDVTFRLSDLKTGVACEPLDKRADPTTDNYDRYKSFFEESKTSTFKQGSKIPALFASRDHMSSPLQKPTGNVARDEQAACREIMRYLWGNRQQATRAGKQMDALDLWKSLWTGPGYLDYEYYSYTTGYESCYDGGVCSVAGEGDTKTKDITVELISNDEYAKRREEACVLGQAHVDERQQFAYDGDLAFEGQTEAFIWRPTPNSVPVLYLQRPFGMKGCLTIRDF